jgi:hypothetical protein
VPAREVTFFFQSMFSNINRKRSPISYYVIRHALSESAHLRLQTRCDFGQPGAAGPIEP